MNNWSKRRKLMYVGTIFGILFLIIFVPLLFKLYKKPTCFDGKQNQRESGIDCGGPCLAICTPQIRIPEVTWTDSFEISDGVYSAVAIIENPNINVSTKNINYIFRMRDRSGSVLAEKKGSTFIPNIRTMAIFESGILIDGEPLYTEFEFEEGALWQKDESIQPDVALRSKSFSKKDTSPRLEARLENKSFEDISRLEIVTLVYDDTGNVIGTSRTFVDSFLSDAITDIVFTWSKPFLDDPVDAQFFMKSSI